ncbi:Sodium-dependent nutrient amino acid transporter 1 [Pseudolycoriella hygida]|uniref:Transporter n=1 Tax=Pseudolycoriella hygida TaxID=35572 RepID=A0A9Q0S6T2_9DIPT|nr:Sodium-dependent nutrient amino acid transporter 1 [Pseudolycoriella hygida]
MDECNTLSKGAVFKRYINSLIFSLKTCRSATEQNAQIREADIESAASRDSWGNGWEFLMSCIALSVGLGNVWRFPFTALDNGGGAFIIPYIVVLFLVGKPVYYLEMVIGQFSSRSSIKAFDLCPISRGIGVGQVLATGMATGYYASLLAIIIRYFVASFYAVLPWSYCQPEWGPTCVDSASTAIQNKTNSTSSAELYFYKEVLKEKETIYDGAGAPDLQLSLYLALAWVLVSLIMIKGIRSSGKASYFLAIFPYIVMAVLFVRAVTLPGAVNGIVYLFKPQWSELLNPRVWYAAVSQVFFSLAICFGNIIMLSSYNQFSHNIHRDATIVTLLDTFTSLFSATIIFGILGNLAYENGSDDIKTVVSGDTGLAFVSYPNAISKFENVPQVFSVLFFFMLFVLGIGSNVGMNSCMYTAIKDRFTHLSPWKIVVPIAVIQFFIGLMYVTPGGQHLLRFVDFFGASFVAFLLAIAQMITFGWIYGVNRLCLDIELMLGIKTGWYWRICWAVVTPALLIAIFVYNLVSYEPITYKGHEYPHVAYAIGWVISAVGIMQLPLWAIYAVYKQKGNTLKEKFLGALSPTGDWGPKDSDLKNTYEQMLMAEVKEKSIFGKIRRNIFG